MLAVLLTLLLVALGLVAILWTGTILAQSTIYDSPVDGLRWRAPAAGGALALFLLIWTLIEYATPGASDSLFSFSSLRSTEINRFISVRKNESGEFQEIPFERRAMGGTRSEFRDEKGTLWARSTSGMMVAIIVEENGDRKRFNAEMVGDKFKTPAGNQPLRYLEENGRRYITEDQIGKVYSSNRSGLALTIILNLFHLALWFAVLWPLLQFQWSHALGFAVLGWLVLTLALLPYLLGRARDAAEKKAKLNSPATALVFPNERLAVFANRLG